MATNAEIKKAKTYSKYFWQGEPVLVEYGGVYIEENTEKPLFWYNYECNWNSDLNKPKYGDDKGALIPAIKIFYYRDHDPFIISNHFGIGVNKLLKGGSPRHTHFSFADDVKFECTEYLPSYTLEKAFKITEFNEEGFSKHEASRKKWQQQNFPEEFEKLEILKNSFRNATTK